MSIRTKASTKNLFKHSRFQAMRKHYEQGTLRKNREIDELTQKVQNLTTMISRLRV